MKSVFVAIRDFQNRFPQAVNFFAEHQIAVIARDAIASLSQEERRFLLTPTEALFVAAEPCSAEFLSTLPNVKIVSRMGSGMDNIDLNYCRSSGIAVTNSKGCNANSVAEMTLLLILASLRGLRKMVVVAQTGEWSKRYPGDELSRKIVGLVGFGMIAQKLALLLKPFDVQIIACDPLLNQDVAAFLNVVPVSFDELITRADVVSVHIPSLPENVGLFNKRTFNAMKDHAVFVNCSRGALVIEEDLYHALQNGKLSSAASDVWCDEPTQPHHPLFELPNFIGTPHIAGMTVQSSVSDSLTVAKSIVAFFEGKEIPYRVV